VSTPRVIPGVVDVHYRWTGPEGQLCENVMQMHYNATPTVAALIALSNDLASTVISKFTQFQAYNITWREIFIKDIGAASGRAEYTHPLGIGVVGQINQEPDTLGSALHATLRTGLTGRSNHGGKSLGGFTEAHTFGSVATNQLMTWVADLGAALIILRTGGGITFDPCVASLALGTFKSIFSFLLPDSNLDSQKTRLPGHGR